MLSSADEDRLYEKDELEDKIRAEYETDIARYRSIINSFFESFKAHGMVSPENNMELRTMALLGRAL